MPSLKTHRTQSRKLKEKLLVYLTEHQKLTSFIKTTLLEKNLDYKNL